MNALMPAGMPAHMCEGAQGEQKAAMPDVSNFRTQEA
jgi:hypothetical protein